MTLDVSTVSPDRLHAARAEFERAEKEWRTSAVPSVRPDDLRRQQEIVERHRWECRHWRGERNESRARRRTLQSGVRWHRFLAWVLEVLRDRSCVWILVASAIVAAQSAVICVAAFSPHVALLLELLLLCACALGYALRVLVRERGAGGAIALKLATAASGNRVRLSARTAELARANVVADEAEEQLRRAVQALTDAETRYAGLEKSLALRGVYEAAKERYDELLRLVQSRKYQLLHSNWRDMRGEAFEQFLAEVFELLGYAVTLTKASGDQGIDLIVSGNGLKVGVQAKGYQDNVSNHAIMEAHAGMTYYGCHYSVVVTNSDFTRAARDLAASVNCRLIAGRDLPQLILGEIPLGAAAVTGV